VYIPNPVDASEFPPIARQDKKEVVFVGWIIKTKGVEELIEAWKSVKRAFPEYSLRMVGPYQEKYKDYIQTLIGSDHSIILQGGVPHSEALEYINQCAVFLLPSYTEGFPNVILEAMMLKKAIIATNVGAIPEMLGDGSGVLIQPRSSEQIKIALIEMLGSEDQAARCAENAFQRVNNLYRIETVFHQYDSVWNNSHNRK
jgi:glycosyltransferase involved in cell wall biosynthesis